MRECRGAIGADCFLPESVAVDCGARDAADIGGESKVEGDWVWFSEIGGLVGFGVTLRVTPETDYGIL